MKNHIAIKFLAVLLCAASLLGFLGSTGGIIALTAMDLYNKTVDQVIEENLRVSSQYLAEAAARRYASVELGGVPEELLYRFGLSTDFLYLPSSLYRPVDYGYALLDADGNVLLDANFPQDGDGRTFSFPVYGDYAHIISLEEAVPIPSDSPDGYGIINNLDFRGPEVYKIHIDREDGSGSTFTNGDRPLGYLYATSDGSVSFRAEVSWLDIGEVLGVDFYDQDDELIFSARGEQAVGRFYTDVQYPAAFQLYTGQEHSSTQEMPFYAAEFTMLDGSTEYLSSASPLGNVYFDDDENVIFQLLLWVTALKDPEQVTGFSLMDQIGTVFYAYNTGTPAVGGGLFFYDNSCLRFDLSRVDPEATAQEAALSDSNEATQAPEEDLTESTPEEAPTSETTPPEVTSTSGTESPMDAAEPADGSAEPKLASDAQYGVDTVRYTNRQGQQMKAEYIYTAMPEYTVEVYVSTEMQHQAIFSLLELVRAFRNDLFLVLGASLLIFAIFAVYLCCAAGHKPRRAEIRPGGLNCMPLDMYLALTVAGVCGAAMLSYLCVGYLLPDSFLAGTVLGTFAAFLGCLLIVGFLFAFAAQVKTPGGYWWRNSLFIRCLSLVGRLLKWGKNLIFRRCLPWIGQTLKQLWQFIRRCLGSFGRIIKRFFAMLPLTWQWIVAGFAMVLLLLIAVAGRYEGLMLCWCIAAPALVLYGSHCFGILLRSTKRMSEGDLDTKITDKHLVGCFGEFAGDLNALADVAVVAAQKQLKSERMKTELITNVSHDIKTPLTSIINYVDLLQKPHTDDQQDAYLEVLARQSQQLKKLIEDLMEMSKASTGNMNVDIIQLDAVEAVNQALGEFSDKLEKAQLIPVFRHTAQAVPMMADGRLVWRVLSNLLSNAVKYAMPGTRLYIDLTALEGKVVLSLKNISRDELNVEADELMERFVRGDDSRNTEGSGLGLNIAKSLMELQKGQLQLLVDGDLFKVTLIFPGE